MDGYDRRMRGRWFGAFVLIAVGVVGLVANFDLIPREMLDQIWKLWPLIPLAIGIDLLLFRRRRYLNDGGSRPNT
jgi:cadmium resistance protein CadD (predicted permease)